MTANLPEGSVWPPQSKFLTGGPGSHTRSRMLSIRLIHAMHALTRQNKLIELNVMVGGFWYRPPNQNFVTAPLDVYCLLQFAKKERFLCS